MSVVSKGSIIVVCAFVLFILAASTPVLARTDSPPLENPGLVSAPDAPLPLNHFWCYQVATSQPVSVTVRTQDQFDTRLKRTRVQDPNRLCNPVRKLHNGKVTGILNPDDHLVLYNIGKHSGDPKLQVQVRNQFGGQPLNVFFPAEVLMVPSRKLPHGPVKDTDHFKCYSVTGQPKNVTVGLQDQFQQASAAVVLQPVWLCNPTRKIHNNIATGVKHADAHLVCYAVNPTQFTKEVRTVNQFRREKLTVLFSDLLCVPSRKKILP